MQYTSNFDLSVVTELADIASKINLVEIVTPVNVAEEKKRWIDFTNPYKIPYSPTFRYDEQLLRDTASKRQRLETMKYYLLANTKAENAIDELIISLIKRRINELEKTAEIAACILNGDDLQTARLSTEIYGCPSADQVLRCYDVAENNNIRSYLSGKLPGPRFLKGDLDKLKAMEFDAEKISFWFNEVLSYYGIDGWTVEIDDRYTAIDVRDRSSSGHPVVGIPASRNVNGLKLLGLIGHEIECHLRSSENSRALFANLLGEQSPLMPLVPLIAKNSNELLYEGQAKVSDVSVNGAMAIPTPYYTIAGDQARRGHNFGDVGFTIFKMLTNDMAMSEEDAASKAWGYTYRVFRGSTKPSEKNEYCFSKDYSYESGWFIAREIDPIYLEYASLSLNEIIDVIRHGVDISNPKYRNLDAVEWVSNRLLNETK